MLFLGLLMYRLFAAPLAVFLEFDFTLNRFLIFLRPVVRPAAFRAGEFYQTIL